MSNVVPFDTTNSILRNPLVVAVIVVEDFVKVATPDLFKISLQILFTPAEPPVTACWKVPPVKLKFPETVNVGATELLPKLKIPAISEKFPPIVKPPFPATPPAILNSAVEEFFVKLPATFGNRSLH
ncbi:MAG: hypothetical protein ACOYNS_15870 [Bacteroidota bacterium]